MSRAAADSYCASRGGLSVWSAPFQAGCCGDGSGWPPYIRCSDGPIEDVDCSFGNCWWIYQGSLPGPGTVLGDPGFLMPWEPGFTVPDFVLPPFGGDAIDWLTWSAAVGVVIAAILMLTEGK